MFRFEPNDFFWEFLVSPKKLPEFLPESICLRASATQAIPKPPIFVHTTGRQFGLTKAVALGRIR